MHLKVTNATDGEEVLPILWEDNYFSLLPGQTRQVMANYRNLGKVNPVVQVDGWNVKP